jgi:hypothetical protein
VMLSSCIARCGIVCCLGGIGGGGMLKRIGSTSEYSELFSEG